MPDVWQSSALYYQRMSKSAQLKAITSDLEAAAGSLPLSQTSADIVPGEGTPDAEILLIGEAPGYHESVQRRPFVGVSGKLLRKTLEEVGYPPETVYISNIVKARPPENRDPTPAEIAAYKPFLDREIQAIQPKIIVTLGRFSMAKFLPDVRISQIHGRLQKIRWSGQRMFILPMYHPAAALRSTAMKEAFLADFQKLPNILKWIAEQSAADQFTDAVAEALLQ